MKRKTKNTTKKKLGQNRHKDTELYRNRFVCAGVLGVITVFLIQKVLQCELFSFVCLLALTRQGKSHTIHSHVANKKVIHVN